MSTLFNLSYDLWNMLHYKPERAERVGANCELVQG